MYYLSVLLTGQCPSGENSIAGKFCFEYRTEVFVRGDLAKVPNYLSRTTAPCAWI